MSIIDPMYQYSLQWFTRLFERTCNEAEPADDVDGRIVNLKDFFTYLLYDQVCRSLFENHKLLFSFVMCINMLQSYGKIDSSEWRFLISGQATGDALDLEIPDVPWITIRVWTEVTVLSILGSYEGLAQDIYDNIDKWQEYFDSGTPHTFPLPGKWKDCLST